MESPQSGTRKVAIVMSRLPKLIDPQAVWLSGLRACLRRIATQRQTLLITPGTAGANFIRRGAERLGIKTQNVTDVEPDPNGDSAILDKRLAKQADELLVLGLRARGNWHRLLTARMTSGRTGVVLVDLDNLQPRMLQQELLNCGAEAWTPTADLQQPFGDETFSPPNQLPVEQEIEQLGPAADCMLHPLPSNTDWSFLTHTTRACPGPWPEQSTEGYLDSVLNCREDGWHSELMTLTRILRQKRLIASNRAIRGGFSVVSLTEVPLVELPVLHRFRPHRMRWDFAPYGICIRRSVLIQSGARPVIYATEESWSELSAEDQPYFQLHDPEAIRAVSDAATTPSSIDWSVEREWRHLGSLDLSQVDANDILVFVPTFEDARKITPHTNWPITLWPAEPIERKH
jgi:hypothetical protein